MVREKKERKKVLHAQRTTFKVVVDIHVHSNNTTENVLVLFAS